MMRKNSPKNRGQELVEFALVVWLILIPVVFGVLDLGRVFQAFIAVTNSAREVARFSTMYPDKVTGSINGSGTCVSNSGPCAAAIGEAQNLGVVLNLSNIRLMDFSDANGDHILDPATTLTVRVVFPVNLILGPTIQVARSISMMVP